MQRAGIFIAFGLGGVIPSMHVLIKYGLWSALNDFSLGWLALMAVLYIGGALIYAFRIPERIFPGKFDIWVRLDASTLTCARALYSDEHEREHEHVHVHVHVHALLPVHWLPAAHTPSPET